MKIIYRRSTIIRGKKWPPKTIMRVTDRKGKQLIAAGIADEYNGIYPPMGRKVKFNLLQLNT
jgi:hypothetical protein